MYALKGLALPRASHFGEIALSGSRRLRSPLAPAPVLFAHAVATEVDIGRIITPVKYDRVRFVFAAPPRIIVAPAPITAITPEDSAPVVHHTPVLCSGELVWNMFALQALSL